MQRSSDHDMADESAALAAFTQALPHESATSRQERREAGAKRVKQALCWVLVCAMCVSATTTIAVLVAHPQSLLHSVQIATGAVVGAIFGGFLLPLLVLLKRIRRTGLFADERIDPVPTFHWSGALGSIGGCALFIGVVGKGLFDADKVGATLVFVAASCGVALFLGACGAQRLLSMPRDRSSSDS